MTELLLCRVPRYPITHCLACPLAPSSQHHLAQGPGELAPFAALPPPILAHNKLLWYQPEGGMKPAAQLKGQKDP